MLDVRRLRLLRELAHHGTIAAAAEAVNYTASAVSQQVRTQGIGAILHAHGMLRRLP